MIGATATARTERNWFSSKDFQEENEGRVADFLSY
jgi:hypothetical protein